MLFGVEVRETDVEPVRACSRPANGDPGRRFSIASRDRLLHTLAQRVQAHEVGIRIENHEPKRRLE